MVELKEINTKIFYFWAGGLIIEVLTKEILKKAFAFSFVLGICLLASFLINKFSEEVSLFYAIKEFIEDKVECLEDLLE
jgi:hypothetical protein